MTKKSGPAHVVVDGSNIATEGRSLPSLQQLNEAVTSFMEEHPGTLVTVVVDATFGHRIPRKEAKEYEAGIANNELVAPPAGAVGRGDAFVLGIADKAKAAVLSNDSFQEFHGEYSWLFDEGRLIGGKPVPHVGWVFVSRVPVRGAASRKATRAASGTSSRSRTPSKAASEPMPVPSAPPPTAPKPGPEPGPVRAAAPKTSEPVNDLMPFLEFVEHHPVGTSVNGTVDAYSSHGAYVTIGDHGVRGYVPLRLMADPAPRSARKVLGLGESTTLVVVSFAPERRSIDCALPDMADAAIAAAKTTGASKAPAQARGAASDDAVAPAPRRRRGKRSTVPSNEAAAEVATDGTDVAEPYTRTVGAVAGAASDDRPAETSADRPPVKKPARSTPARRSRPKPSPAVVTSAEASGEPKPEDSAASGESAEAAAAMTSHPPKEKAPARKSATRKTATRKSSSAATTQAAGSGDGAAGGTDSSPSSAAKAPAKKRAVKKATAKKAPAKKAAEKKAPARNSATKATPVKKAATKKAPAKKTAAKRAPAKASATTRAASSRSSSRAGTSDPTAGD